MIFNVEYFKKYYVNATKEEVIEDMFLDCREQAKEIERLNQYIDFYKDLTERQNKNLERLNNIINELEKWLNEEYDATIFDYHNAIEDVIDKLIELKGSE